MKRHVEIFLLIVSFYSLCAFSEVASIADDYRISASDILTIKVFGEEDLSFESIRIPIDGNISYPLIGVIKVSGSTTREIEQEIERRLADGYLKKPVVTVFMVEYRNIYVYGEVQRPGAYPFHRGLTVEKAIAVAGGLTPRGSMRKINIAREENPDLTTAVKKNTPIKPGDVITIGESFF